MPRKLRGIFIKWLYHLSQVVNGWCGDSSKASLPHTVLLSPPATLYSNESRIRRQKDLVVIICIAILKLQIAFLQNIQVMLHVPRNDKTNAVYRN